jgi:hypothetical protein
MTKKKVQFQELLTAGFAAFKKDWKVYGLFVLTLMTLPQVLLAFTPLDLYPLWTVLLLVILIVASTKLQIMITFLASRTLKKKKTKVRQVQEAVIKKFFPVIGGSLLVGLIFFAIILPFLIVSSIITGFMGESSVSVGLAIILVGGGIITALLYCARFAFVSPLLVLEKIKIKEALQTSAKLFKKNYWKNILFIIGLWVISTIIVVITELIIGYPLGLYSVALAASVVGLVQGFLVLPIHIAVVDWYQKIK